MIAFTIPANLSTEVANEQRSLNHNYPFHWRALEADEGMSFYRPVREDGTVRGARPDWDPQISTSR